MKREEGEDTRGSRDEIKKLAREKLINGRKKKNENSGKGCEKRKLEIKKVPRKHTKQKH